MSKVTNVLLYQLCTSVPILSQFIVPCLVLTVASWSCIQVSWETGKVDWYSHLFKDFPHRQRLYFVLIHIVKDFSVVNEAEVDIFLDFSCFFYGPVNVGNLISGSSPFANPACTSGGCWFMHCWSLVWRILSITFLLNVKWVQLYGSLNILWNYPGLGLEWKLTFSSPVSLADFSKFADSLSIAL